MPSPAAWYPGQNSPGVSIWALKLSRSGFKIWLYHLVLGANLEKPAKPVSLSFPILTMGRLSFAVLQNRPGTGALLRACWLLLWWLSSLLQPQQSQVSMFPILFAHLASLPICSIWRARPMFHPNPGCSLGTYSISMYWMYIQGIAPFLAQRRHPTDAYGINAKWTGQAVDTGAGTKVTVRAGDSVWMY